MTENLTCPGCGRDLGPAVPRCVVGCLPCSAAKMVDAQRGAHMGCLKDCGPHVLRDLLATLERERLNPTPLDSNL